MTATWFFPPLSGGEEKGLNEAGVEAFKRIHSLGRETCQNIGDARPNGSSVPAIATFDFRLIPAAHFPGLEQFRNHMKACQKYVLEGNPDGTANEAAFFERALEMLDRPQIPMMRIGDRNTTGLIGADLERTKPFFRLIRGQGSSSLQGVGGGTYGIGQRAPFAHSALRTVIYSTRTAEGVALVAKSILATHPRPADGEKTQATAWWCVNDVRRDSDGWTALRDERAIPKIFHREEVGTDLWVTGFEATEWEKAIRHSVLVHFFAAIANKQLVVELADQGTVIRTITADNLEDELYRAADEVPDDANTLREDQIKTPKATVYFHRALKSPIGGAPFVRNIPRLGEVKFYVWRDAQDPGAPERWMTMRKPRILVESFGSGLLSGFAGVLSCDTEEGNRYLALMEGPKHEEWDESEARNWTDAEKREGRAAINAIKAFVRDTLKAIRGSQMPATQDVPFLGRYLPAEDESVEQAIGTGTVLAGEATDTETGAHRTKDATGTQTGKARRVVPSSVRRRAEGASSGGGDGMGGTGDGGGGGGGGGDGAGGDTGGTPDRDGSGRRTITPEDVRFRSFVSRDGSYVVQLRPAEALPQPFTGDLRIAAVGEDGNEVVLVSQAELVPSGQQLAVESNVVRDISLLPGKICEIRLRLAAETPMCLSLEV